MTIDPYIRSKLALELFNLYPPSIRSRLISDSNFRKKYSLKADAKVSFGNTGLVFQRSMFFSCIRELLAKSGVRPIIIDESGTECIFGLEGDKERIVTLSYRDQKIYLPNYSAISLSKLERLDGFERDADEVNLPTHVLIEWRDILSQGPLEDELLNELVEEIKDTPIQVAASIRTGVENGSSSLSTLVPRSSRYFDRLVGKLQNCSNVTDYFDTSATEHMKQLMTWQPYKGFLMTLLLSSRPFNPPLADVDKLKDGDLIEAYRWLQEHGDRFSQLGAIEIGLTILDKRPGIEPYVKNIIAQIRDDNVNDDGGRFNLLSALIVLVEGELSRTKILCDKPPFWRRLASIAQASLIEREIVGLGVDIADFTKWAMQNRGQLFYIQTLCDLRQEPRWHPDYISSSQLKAEFVGRILNAAQANDSKIINSELRDLLFGDGSQSCQLLIKFPDVFLPGPLEGGLESQNDPPTEILSAIEKHLGEDTLNPASFVALVNSALVFRIDSQLALLAAKALRSAKHQISKVDDKDMLVAVLRGLATVAAVKRSAELAEELRSLVRKCMHIPSFSISAEDALWIGLTTAAAHPELKDWCQFVGEFVTELAFQPLQHDVMEKLHSHVLKLCHVVPELWLTCGRAEAALCA